MYILTRYCENMPAKRLRRVVEEGSYSHVYNVGVGGGNVFNDKEDYEVFLGYLKEYLSPTNHEKAKKSFTVNGQTYHGIPHQPKNYFNEVELVAYSLMPDRFGLLLRQISHGSIMGLMRSLSTRYSIYFNKKYKRTGTVFEGPYKSAHIKSESQLLLLTHHLHKTGGHSSYPEYIGLKESSWVKPGAVLSLFEKAKHNFSNGVENYKDFLEKYEPGQYGKDLLEELVIETTNGSAKKEEVVEEKVVPKAVAAEETPEPSLKHQSRLFELATATAIFFLLLDIGLNNVQSFGARMVTASTAVLSESTSSNASPSPTPEQKMMAVVTTPDISTTANIRKEPDSKSEIIGRAVNGQIFESVSVSPEWDGIKLEDGSIGYISAKYIEIVQSNN